MSKQTHHPAGRYVLRYLDPAPAPPYTRVVKLAIAAADYEDLTFTLNEPLDLDAREAPAYCAVPLPDGLVLVPAVQVVGPSGTVYQIIETTERDASEE